MHRLSKEWIKYRNSAIEPYESYDTVPVLTKQNLVFFIGKLFGAPARANSLVNIWMPAVSENAGGLSVVDSVNQQSSELFTCTSNTRPF